MTTKGEVDGRVLARKRHDRITAKIDAMLDEWQKYSDEVEWICSPCKEGWHDNCREWSASRDKDCGCACQADEYVRLVGRFSGPDYCEAD